jgi:hypothetical protein
MTLLVAASALAPLALVACGSSGTTGADIDRSLADQLKSVAGDWTGTNPGGSLTLTFRLTELAGGQLTGTGSMREAGAAAVPIRITGTFRQPDLTLAFEDMKYEGRNVRGTFRGDYTTVAGVSDSLVLNGIDYTKRVALLLQETSAR